MADSQADAVDTRDMIVVHIAFRREFGLAPALVRGVAVGDRTRAGVVADHLEMLTVLLHHHHAGEDRLLWPKLHARVAADIEPVVALMEEQHNASTPPTTGSWPTWRAGARRRPRPTARS